MTIWITVSLILWMSVIKGIYTTHFGSWFVYTKLQTVTKSPDFLKLCTCRYQQPEFFWLGMDI